MDNRTLKILVFTSTIALLAAGCNSSQPQASNLNAPTNPPAANAPMMPSSGASSTMPGMQGNASSTRSGFGMKNLPAGSKPFFGTIASVSGSQITLSGRSRNSSSTVTTIINVSSSTQYQGGSQTNLAAGARIVGYGTTNSDGSIDAQSININPSLPQGGGRYHGNSSGQAQPQ